MMEFVIADLVTPTRVAISITAITCAIAFYRSFKQTGASSKFLKTLVIWMVVMGAIAGITTHTSIFGNGGALLPVGVVPGFIFAVLSLRWKPAVDAFDKIEDLHIRYLMTYRMIFGAFLIGGAALGLFPPIFAMTAGLGDLLAGWLAIIAKNNLNGPNNKTWRGIVHGWGVLDLLDVAALGTFVVQPWLVTNNSLGPSLLLPWMAVPLLLALNLHGLRRLFSK